MNQMCWMSSFGGNGRKLLHLKIGDRWLPYSATQYAVTDHNTPKGSLGWATFQHLRQSGWQIVASPMDES